MNKSVGGFIQLIIPSESMKWADYKKKYGIDLDEYFETFTVGGQLKIRFKPYINKPFLISGYSGANGGVSYEYLPDCGFLTSIYPGRNLEFLYLYFGFGDYAIGVQVGSDRRIGPIEI